MAKKKSLEKKEQLSFLKENKKKGNPYMRFMGMGAQMLAPILVGMYLGKWIDSYFDSGKTWAVSLTLLGVFAGLFLIIKEVISMSKDE